MSDEGWAEYAETDAAVIREQYRWAPSNMQLALDVVRSAAPGRPSYEEVEQRLGWPRGRLRSVIGGWRSRHGANYTRPYRICPPNRSPKGEWEIWMDEDQAQALA
jgi:hypothetical protein